MDPRPNCRTDDAELDWSQCPVVESVPGKMSGAWVLKKSRMPVSLIVESLEAGAGLNDILEWYDGLDREQVEAACEFIAQTDAEGSLGRPE